MRLAYDAGGENGKFLLHLDVNIGALAIFGENFADFGSPQEQKKRLGGAFDLEIGDYLSILGCLEFIHNLD